MPRLSLHVFGLASMLLDPCVSGQDPVNFEQQIRPLFVQHCGKCHGPTTQKSGLRLDVIRYADTHGFDVNTPRENAWPDRMPWTRSS